MGIPSIIVSDGTQEFVTITEDEAVPSDLTVTNAHSKLFNISQRSVTFNLPEGVERGQIKSVTYCKQDFPNATIEILPKRFYNGVKVVLLQKGDHVQFVWSGFTWIIISSINLMDPEIGPDVIGR